MGRGEERKAAAISTGGLHPITPEPLVVDLPALGVGDGEHAFLLEKMGPKVEAALGDKGFVLLAWSEVGTASFFSTTSRPTLSAMRTGKLFVWSGDPPFSDAFKAGGFNSILLSSVDIVPSFQTGAIDTVLLPPAVLFGLDMSFARTKFLMSPSFATVTGPLVVDRKTWEAIPPDLKQPLLKAAREGCAAGTAMVRKVNADALAAFKKAAGQVVALTDGNAWTAMLADVMGKQVREKVVPAALFDEAQAALKEYRATRK